MQGHKFNPTERFSDRADAYARYRPTYPPEVAGFLKKIFTLGRDTRVADIGSGTGIFTKLLLETGASVTGVEPNAIMREAGEVFLRNFSNFQSWNGTAEATGLSDASVDLVTCAQAFHWFEIKKTHLEFSRILRPPGNVVLVWNIAKKDDPFGMGYEKIKLQFGNDFEKIRHETHNTPERFDAFFGKGRWKLNSFDHHRLLDLDSTLGVMNSASYAPKPEDSTYQPMVEALTALFKKCERHGKIQMHYTTDVYWGHLR